MISATEGRGCKSRCKLKQHQIYTFALSSGVFAGADPRLNLVCIAEVCGTKTSMHPLWQPARMQSSGVTASAVMGP